MQDDQTSEEKLRAEIANLRQRITYLEAQQQEREKQQIQAEQRLQTALRDSSMGLTEWLLVRMPDGTWSFQLEQVHGAAPSPFDGSFQRFLEVLHPEDRQNVKESMLHAIDTCTPHESVFRIIVPGGGIRWITGKGYIFCDETGQANRLLAINQDITEQKQREEERERLFKQRGAELHRGDL